MFGKLKEALKKSFSIFSRKAEEKAEELGATVELPDEYVSDSIEFVKVMENDE